MEAYPDPALEKAGEKTFLDNLQSIFNTMLNGNFDSSDEEEIDPVSTEDIKEALQEYIDKEGDQKNLKISELDDEESDDDENDISDEEKDKAEAEHENYLNQLLEQTAPELDGDGNVISNANGAARNIDQRDIPSNIVTPTKTPCYKSFKNLLRKT